MKQIGKISAIISESSKLGDLLRQTELNTRIHSLICSIVPQTAMFHTSLNNEILSIKVVNQAQIHLFHFNQQQILAMLKQEGIEVNQIKIGLSLTT